MEIGVKITGELKVNGEVAGFSSPTTTLRADIVNEVGSDAGYISKIDKIVLVDSNGSERDYTTSLSYTDNTDQSPPKVVISGTINITAGYNVVWIRLYAGSKKYFEYGWSRTVYVGDQVLVQVTVTVTSSGSLSGTTGATSFVENYSANICKALIGASRQQIGFHHAILLNVNFVRIWEAGFSRNVDTVNMKVTGDTGAVAPRQSDYAIYLQFLNAVEFPMVYFNLSSTISLTSNTLVQVTFTFTC